MNVPRWIPFLALTGCFSPSMVDAGTGSTTAEDTGATTTSPASSSDASSSSSAEVDDTSTAGAESATTSQSLEGTSTGEQTSTTDSSGSSSSDDTTGGGTTAVDHTKRVFVSSERIWSVEVDDADTLCQELADAAQLGGSWVAWTSTSDIDAIDKLDPAGGPYVLLDESATVIAVDNADLVDGQLATNIGLNELGEPPEGVINTWTGTSFDGTLAQNNCADWTVPTSAAMSTFGSLTSSANCWTDCSGLIGCGAQIRVYCFEH